MMSERQIPGFTQFAELEASRETLPNVSPPMYPNDVAKHPLLHMAGFWEGRGMSFPYPQWEHGGESRRTWMNGEWAIAVSGGYNRVPDADVVYATIKFVGIPIGEYDGAMVSIKPGKMTDAQMITCESTIREVLLDGSFIILGQSPEGEFSLNHLVVGQKENSPYMGLFSRNWIMSIYACEGQREIKNHFGEIIGVNQARVLEVVSDPGFTDSSFVDIPEGISSYNGHDISSQYWKMRSLLRCGREDEVLNQCVKLSS